MKYCSTRGGVKGVSFKQSLLMGLGSDGGLLVPEQIPDVTPQLEHWRALDFPSLAKELISIFADDIDRATLDRLVDQAYSTFDHPDVVPMRELGDITLVELFHGPTLAFKDVALQLLGQLFEHALAEDGRHLNILGATSGDTGSAAIAGVRGQPNIDIYILYPNDKVSPLQELQMTTVPDLNVHCVAVNGSFDDCQSLMKAVFADLEFKETHSLGAVNSVNWARVMAQVVYYGYISLKFDEPVSFCVPTGNFGNVFAAFLARKMGFPIAELVVGTNENDILARFFHSGEYARGDVHYTLSPAMDIQVASNFERFLYYYFDCDAERLRAFMNDFQQKGEAHLERPPTDAGFLATSVNTEETVTTLRDVYAEFGYVLDPHTAVGVSASKKCATSGPKVCIATAHPAKFPDAVKRALPEVDSRHPTLDALTNKAERKVVIEPTVEAVKALFD
ncbi:MAG: threonine synthase [Pseudomonadales bacterium]|nr:threonine synthase [Pseudomonadales bacterium]